MGRYDTAAIARVSFADALLRGARYGDIIGAFGSIDRHDVAARDSWKKRLLTLLATLGRHM